MKMLGCNNSNKYKNENVGGGGVKTLTNKKMLGGNSSYCFCQPLKCEPVILKTCNANKKSKDTL